MKDYATVDDWFADQDRWQEEVAALRALVLQTGLTETVKWGQPCYTDNGKNIVILGWLKDCALASLFKGALVDDPRQRLVQPGQDRSGRYMPFTSVQQVEKDAGYLRALIEQAIQVERAGLRVPPLPDDIEYVEELQERLQADDALREAFEALTPGRRRGYNLHFERAKRSSTRHDRITRCTERIMLGKGLLDCVCGHSKRYPSCDGSHKDYE